MVPNNWKSRPDLPVFNANRELCVGQNAEVFQSVLFCILCVSVPSDVKIATIASALEPIERRQVTLFSECEFPGALTRCCFPAILICGELTLPALFTHRFPGP
jgi:hypothetical protein